MAKRSKGGGNPPAEHMTPFLGTPGYMEPSHEEKMKDVAKDAMRQATGKWIRGEMSSEEHSRVHSKARHVLKHPHKAALFERMEGKKRK